MGSDEPKQSWWSSWRKASPEGPVTTLELYVRLTRLQRALRINRAVLIVLALTVAWLGLLRYQEFTAPAQALVRAHKVEVVSKDGYTVLVLDADRVGGRIAVRYNTDAKPPPPAIFLTATPTGGTMQVYERGHPYYALGIEVASGGQGVLKVRSRAQQAGVELRGPADENAGGELSVFNALGNPAVRLAADAAGRGVLLADPPQR